GDQLAVGVKDVEFGVVGGVGGAGSGGVVACRRQVAALSGDQAVDGFGDEVPVGGEILQQVEPVGEAHDGHGVGSGHVGAYESHGVFLGANLILQGHGGHIEVQDQQAAVLVLDFARLAGGDGGWRRGGRGGRSGGVGRRKRLPH